MPNFTTSFKTPKQKHTPQQKQAFHSILSLSTRNKTNMAPSGRTITAPPPPTTTTVAAATRKAASRTKTRRTTRRIRHPRRTNNFKKQQKQEKTVLPSSNEGEIVDSSSIGPEVIDCDGDLCNNNTNNNNSACSTPKGQKFRIPEISTCPPAPKKQRVLSSSNCSLRRSPLSFFSPPDLELFFFMALSRDVSV